MTVTRERDDREHLLIAVGEREVVADAHAGAELHRSRRQQRQVDRGEAHQTAEVVTAPISARLVVSSVERMASCLLRRAGSCGRGAVGALGQVDARDPAGGREEHAARDVGDLERGGRSPRAAAPAIDGRASVSRVRRGVP